MNFEEKQKIHIRLRDALEAEKISQRIAEECLAINQGYISMIKVGTNLKAVQEKVWDKLKAWSDSRMPITAFKGGVLIHKGNAEPERVPLKVEITTVGDFIDHAQKDLDKAQEEEDTKQEEPVIPTFEEINAEMEEEEAEKAGGQKLPKEPIDPIKPITIESREQALLRFHEQRMLTIKIALRCVLENRDSIPVDWVIEYNDIWLALNQ